MYFYNVQSVASDQRFKIHRGRKNKYTVLIRESKNRVDIRFVVAGGVYNLFNTVLLLEWYFFNILTSLTTRA